LTPSLPDPAWVGDVVKLLWLAIINIEDRRARERAARRQEPPRCRCV
jgi:hypothetical protein